MRLDRSPIYSGMLPFRLSFPRSSCVTRDGVPLVVTPSQLVIAKLPDQFSEPVVPSSVSLDSSSATQSSTSPPFVACPGITVPFVHVCCALCALIVGVEPVAPSAIAIPTHTAEKPRTAQSDPVLPLINRLVIETPCASFMNHGRKAMLDSPNHRYLTTCVAHAAIEGCQILGVPCFTA